MHLAEFNIGTLLYDWDDPRVAYFGSGRDLGNGVAPRGPSFLRMPHRAAMARLRHLVREVETAPAFGWAYLKEAVLWKDKMCGEAA